MPKILKFRLIMLLMLLLLMMMNAQNLVCRPGCAGLGLQRSPETLQHLTKGLCGKRDRGMKRGRKGEGGRNEKTKEEEKHSLFLKYVILIDTLELTSD